MTFFPLAIHELQEERKSQFRLTVSNKNVAGMIGQITTVLADNDLNIIEMTNKSREDIAYSVIDLDSEASEKVISDLSSLDNVIKVRGIL